MAAISKIIKIDDVEVPMRSSAALPRLYRLKFQRDLFKDMEALEEVNKNLEKDENGESHIEIGNLMVFENIAYIMAAHAAQPGSDFPKDPIEWLEQFNIFDIYTVLPQLIEMWGVNVNALETPKKKTDPQSES